MPRFFYTILISFCVLQVQAQSRAYSENPGADTLRVVFHKDKWGIEHRVKQGETLFMLSQMYHVPPAQLADMNGLDFQAVLQGGMMMYIPYGPYNQTKTEPAGRLEAKPLYYIVRKYDNLYRLAHLAGVQQKTLQEWNGMPDNYIEEGKRLFVGWVLHTSSVPAANTPQLYHTDRTGRLQSKYEDKQNPNESIVIIKKAKSADTIPAIERKYLEQTKNGQVVTEEKGSAVFYDDKGKVASKLYYAFHNSAIPGTIIKVHNPGTGKTVYVKVLGPIPNTKMYYNSIIGISEAAKDDLMVTEDKAWCELSYAP